MVWKYNGNNEAVGICDADREQSKAGQAMMQSKKSQNERWSQRVLRRRSVLTVRGDHVNENDGRRMRTTEEEAYEKINTEGRDEYNVIRYQARASGYCQRR